MKRKTKAQREAEQKKALRQRIADIAAGAGVYPYDDGTWYLPPVYLAKIISAIRHQFLSEADREDQYKAVIAYWNLDEYETIDSTVDFLWERGIRA